MGIVFGYALSTMVPHKLRVQLLGLASLVCLVVLVALRILAVDDAALYGLVIGVFATSTAGFFDSLKVERRRRNPSVSAVVDDVISDEAVTLDSQCQCPGCPRCLRSPNNSDACDRTAELGKTRCATCAARKPIRVPA